MNDTLEILIFAQIVSLDKTKILYTYSLKTQCNLIYVFGYKRFGTSQSVGSKKVTTPKS